ncbi:hypothetical protein [Nocardia wallacei]|uniref:hypothetical protein n=1 Tax=Nocardia wallacei TaxID=480035 RepID=UPI0024586BF8|nr:hypothetical protein [Nocardia wallacei]
MNTLLPTHPRFGQAIGFRRNGAPIWPIRGASPEGDPPPNIDPGTTPPAPPTNPPTPPANPDPDALGEGGKKALEAERQARAAAEKAQRAAEAKVKAFEDAQKTEAERTADRIRELERDAAKALRYEAAAAEGLPITSAHRLNGNTLEELRADAAAYKAELAAAAPPPAQPGTPPPPRPDPRQGGGQQDATGSLDAGRDRYRARKAQHK